MYSLDTNINAAIERQADRVRAVRAFGSSWTPAQETASDQGAPNPLVSKAALVLAAMAPVVLIAAWGLLAR